MTDPSSSESSPPCTTATLTTPLLQKPKTLTLTPNLPNPSKDEDSITLTLTEAKSILGLALPMMATCLLLYSRSMVSMLFLGRLGSLPLAGGSLAIGFANITGYSVLSGLATGMEPICGQAVGANRPSLLGLTLHRTILLLLAVSLPISLLWLSMHTILLASGQDPAIAAAANSYIIASLPDLILQSLLHPIRIYLRTQSITLPLTVSAAATLALHLPANYLLVTYLKLGIHGVALACVFTNLTLLIALISYLYISGVCDRTGGLAFTPDIFNFSGIKQLLTLAVPSCVSVCLEWWWYEIMTLLCGFLIDPKSTVAAMGVLIQTTSLIYIFPSSLSYGVCTRVGNELGAGRPDRARRAAYAGLSCSVVLGLFALGFSTSVRGVWAGVFTADAGIARLTAAVLPILGLCELGNCPQTAGCGVLRGSARPRAAANINLGAFYGVGMPVAVGLAFWGGMDFKGLWLGLLAAQGTCVVLMMVTVGRTDWKAQAERAQRLTGGHREDVGGGDEKVAAGDEEDGDIKSSLVISIED